jgi:hypothetical protein
MRTKDYFRVHSDFPTYGLSTAIAEFLRIRYRRSARAACPFWTTENCRLTVLASNSVFVDTAFTVRAFVATICGKGHSQPDRPQHKTKEQPQATICTTAGCDKGSADSAHNPEENQNVHKPASVLCKAH